MPKCVLISDTHERHREIGPLPEGDILIHAGDISNNDDPHGVKALGDFHDWLVEQPFKRKICIAGNHDWIFERRNAEGRALLHDPDNGIIYLQNEAYEFEGLKFYGCPQTPRFMDWAFNVDRGRPIQNFWDQIPEDTNVLITHGPPYGIRDSLPNGVNLGCMALSIAVGRLPNLKLHVFGHIHAGYGRSFNSVNAAICNEAYRPKNPPIVVDI